MDYLNNLLQLQPYVPSALLLVIAIAAWSIRGTLKDITFALTNGAKWMQKHEPMIEEASRELPRITSEITTIKEDIRELRNRERVIS